MLKSLTSCLFILLLTVHTAAANEILTALKINSFLSTIEEVKALSDEMSPEGKKQLTDIQASAMQGNDFTPYRSGVTILKKSYPYDYTKLSDTVGSYGFNSPENWAQTGDDMMAAYVSVKMGDTAQQTMKSMSANMNPEMMAMLPPEAKATIQKTKAMLNTLEKVPAENKKVVAPLMDKIETTMNNVAD